ncbi:DUF3046 domain-containing protein [Leucobacter soli]|uniref:DUF3046 domain-containing protein n=1 Tax=Leucobacter soli TaxID=2812850 RepID=UPI001C401D33|nr:DUF3046 domain-containing protein [Leucobacter soli]
MRLSEFQRAVGEEFGRAYSGVLLRDHWLTGLGATANEALERGVPPRAVWFALCDEFEIPESRRHGRGLLDPRD